MPSEHPFPEGTRVRNYSQQYTEAIRKGTATVLRFAPQHDGTYEYLVQRDEPIIPGAPIVSWWASYSTFRALDAENK